MHSKRTSRKRRSRRGRRSPRRYRSVQSDTDLLRLAAETKDSEHAKDVFRALFAKGKELDYVLGVIPDTHPEWNALAKRVHRDQVVTRQGLDEERPNHDQLMSMVEMKASQLFREQLDKQEPPEALARTWINVMGSLRHVGPRSKQVTKSIYNSFRDKHDKRRLKKGWKKMEEILAAASGP